MRHLATKSGAVYNLAQAKRDIASIYSTGLYEDVNIAPREAEDSTETSPKVRESEGGTGGTDVLVICVMGGEADAAQPMMGLLKVRLLVTYP